MKFNEDFLFSATDLLRKYFSIYGLIQIGTDLLGNCFILYILQMNGWDIASFSIIVVTCSQAFIACAFGEALQSEAGKFASSLYSTDWLNMSIRNRKMLLLLMLGSEKNLNIRAGGTYELNLALFAQVF